MLNRDFQRAPEYKTVTEKEARRLMEGAEPFTLADVRSREEYDAGHLPGAVSLPDIQLTQLAPRALPDRDRLILDYCDRGGRSRVAAQVLTALGYRRVYDLGGRASALEKEK